MQGSRYPWRPPGRRLPGEHALKRVTRQHGHEAMCAAWRITIGPLDLSAAAEVSAIYATARVRLRWMQQTGRSYMFAVIFEVVPKPERKDDYLELGKFLRPEIEKIEGFLDNERFASQGVPGRVLSLSTWRDEKAVIRWRTLAVHHQVQEKGRFEVFRDYHLRVGEFTADSRPPPGQVLRQQRLDETEVGAAKYVTITELAPHDGKPAVADLAGALGLPSARADG